MPRPKPQDCGMTTLILSNGTPVARFAYGTMQWGGTADAAASQEMFEHCRSAGITHFDTAAGYTGGASEQLLGRFAKACRDDIFVATKVGYVGGASPENIHKQFDVSRQRLDMECIDLLYLHRFDDDTPLEQTFEAMANLQAKGHIRAIGVSNYAAWQVMKAQAVCARLGTKIDAIQPMYNLVKRQAEVEIFPMAVDQGMAIVPYSPLGGGLLTGKYNTGQGGRLRDDDRYAARYAPRNMHEAAKELSKLAADNGIHPATLAVAWVARNETTPHPIISARSVAQLQPSLDAMSFDLSHALYTQVSALFAAPPPATDRLEESDA